MTTKKILLLSPYDVPSHRYWWQGLKENLNEYDWTILSLEPRYFAWRMRGNSLTWAYEQKELLEQDYDLLIACSMTDLSSLRGFVPKLTSIPTLIYCHENQFFYPHNEQQQGKVEQQIIQLYSFECADKIIFNSHFNKDTCLEGIQSLLKKLPDHVPKEIFANIKNKSEVLPIPINDKEFSKSIIKPSEFNITWNHRWEYDKGPEQLFYLVDSIIKNKLDCKINIIGQIFREVPKYLKTTIDLLEKSKQKGVIGFIEDREKYLNLLAKSQVVLSTSLHDFQGLAIMEAVLLDCIPVLPNRLSYKEFFHADFLYDSFDNDPKLESKAAFAMLIKHYTQWNNGDLKPRELDIKSIPTWVNQKAVYQLIFEELIHGS